MHFDSFHEFMAYNVQIVHFLFIWLVSDISMPLHCAGGGQADCPIKEAATHSFGQ